MFFNLCCCRRNINCSNNCHSNCGCRERKQECCFNRQSHCSCQHSQNCCRQQECRNDWDDRSNINSYEYYNQNNNYGNFQRGGCGRGVEPIFYENSYSNWGNNCQGLTILNPTNTADNF